MMGVYSNWEDEYERERAYQDEMAAERAMTCIFCNGVINEAKVTTLGGNASHLECYLKRLMVMEDDNG